MTLCHLTSSSGNIKSLQIQFADSIKADVGDNHEEDSSMVQCGLDFLIIWMHASNLWFNTTKCKLTHLGKKNSVSASVMGDSVLQRVNVFLSVDREYWLQKRHYISFLANMAASKY